MDLANTAIDTTTDTLDNVIDELRRLYGDDFRLFAGVHHARYLPADVAFHVISRVFQGRYLLRPGRQLNRIIGGVIGRAQHVFPSIKLFANAFLSNHMHLMLQGPAPDVAAFVGFVKREISRRWGAHPDINWPGTMWHGYIATALPSPQSQIACFKYVLSQGVKEGLVAKPQLWPGIHSAKQLLSGANLTGEWLDATAYAVARDRERRKVHPKPVLKARFYRTYEAVHTQIAPWSNLSPEEYRDRIRALCDEIEREAEKARGGRPPVGTKAVMEMPLETRSELPTQPWIMGRRRMICWAQGATEEARAYVDRHWTFQQAFRTASLSYLAGDRGVAFPAEAFLPSVWPLRRQRQDRLRPD